MSIQTEVEMRVGSGAPTSVNLTKVSDLFGIVSEYGKYVNRRRLRWWRCLTSRRVTHGPLFVSSGVDIRTLWTGTHDRPKKIVNGLPQSMCWGFNHLQWSRTTPEIGYSLSLFFVGRLTRRRKEVIGGQGLFRDIKVWHLNGTLWLVSRSVELMFRRT